MHEPDLYWIKIHASKFPNGGVIWFQKRDFKLQMRRKENNIDLNDLDVSKPDCESTI